MEYSIHKKTNRDHGLKRRYRFDTLIIKNSTRLMLSENHAKNGQSIGTFVAESHVLRQIYIIQETPSE